MARLPIQAEGKSKKQAARNLNRRLHEAEVLGLYKDGKTLYMVSQTGTVVAMTCVHS
jgi:hypothetical protein